LSDTLRAPALICHRRPTTRSAGPLARSPSPRPVNLHVGQPSFHDNEDGSDALQPWASTVSCLLGFSRRWFRITTVVTILVLAVPLAADAQALPKVGYLSIGSASDPRRLALLGAFQQGLREVGYVEGKSILIEVRFDEGQYDRLPDLAAELARLKVDIILAYSTPAARAAQSTTKSIPIVMSSVVDPLSTGLVASLGRPGANITGLSLMAPEVIGKQIQLLKELVPTMSRVAVLWNPANASNVPQLREAEVAAPVLDFAFNPWRRGVPTISTAPSRR
jgi:hypothetical protein